MGEIAPTDATPDQEVQTPLSEVPGGSEPPSRFETMFSPAPPEMPAEKTSPTFTDKFTPDAATLGEAAETTARGVSTGLVGFAPAVAGGAVGFKAGVAASALFPPAAPVIVPLATIGGIAAGWFAGEKAQEFTEPLGLTAREEKVAPHLRPYHVGGSAFGATIPMAGLPVGLAKTGFEFAAKGWLGKWGNAVLRTAKESPGWFTAVELGAGATSGIGEGVSEALNPGELWPRFYYG